MFYYTHINPPASGIRSIQVSSTAESVIVTSECQDTAVSYPVKQDYTVVLDVPEFEIEAPRPKPVRNSAYQPTLREIASPWKARWRLRQQRPRDGLR